MIYGGPLDKYSEIHIYFSVQPKERNPFWIQNLLKTKAQFKLCLLIITSIDVA